MQCVCVFYAIHLALTEFLVGFIIKSTALPITRSLNWHFTSNISVMHFTHTFLYEWNEKKVEFCIQLL